MSTRDEQPFTFSAANAEQSRSGVNDPSAPPRQSDRHTFIRFANSRYETCVRCGRPEHDVVHKARP